MTARWWRLLAIALVVSFAIRAARLAQTQSVTVDEYVHLACGLAHVVHGDFGMQPWSLPLAPALLALPALTLGPSIPHIPHGLETDWKTGAAFAASNRGHYRELYARSRVLAVVLGLALLGCAWAWSRRLWGERAATVTLAAAALEPNLIAHASMVMTDTALALTTVLTLWSATRLIDAQRAKTIFCLGGALGAALLTKLTALVLIPVVVVTALARGRPRRAIVVRVASAGILALFVINLGYGFRGSLRPLGDIPFLTHRGRELGRLGVRLPVPAPFLRAIDYRHALGRQGSPTYLNGRVRERAPWYYVLAALGMKSTTGFLVLALATVVFLLLRVRRGPTGVVLLTLAVIAYLSAGMRSPLNDGVRHVLPLYALIAVASGGLAVRFPRLALAFLVAHGAESGAAWGGELAFFNVPTRVIAVDADRGVYPLLGSAADFGQDLPALREILDRERIAGRVNLAYSGRVDPRIYGIDYVLPRAPFAAGWYAVSVTHLSDFRYVVLDPETGMHRFLERGELAWFRARTPVARAGASILLYRVGDED